MEKEICKNNVSDLEQLFVDLSHPNPNINEQACLRMLSAWPSESMARLIKNLANEDVALRRKSVKALGLFGHIALPHVVDLFLQNENKIVRTSCLKVLVKIAAASCEDSFPAEVFKAIEIALKDDSPEITLSVVSLLRQMGKDGLPLLIRIAKDEDILRSTAAISALSELNSPIIQTCLSELVNDLSRDEMVRLAANESLKALAGGEII